MNGAKLDLSGALQIPQSTMCMVVSQDSFWAIIAVFNVWCTLSINPLLCGWYAVVLNL